MIYPLKSTTWTGGGHASNHIFRLWSPSLSRSNIQACTATCVLPLQRPCCDRACLGRRQGQLRHHQQDTQSTAMMSTSSSSTVHCWQWPASLGYLWKRSKMYIYYKPRIQLLKKQTEAGCLCSSYREPRYMQQSPLMDTPCCHSFIPPAPHAVWCRASRKTSCST